MQLDAPIVPIVIVVDGRAGLTLWAPPFDAPSGEVWESFLGQENEVRISLFATASDMYSFIQGAGRDAFAGHPAWPGMRRRAAEQLRSSPGDVIDFDSVYLSAELEPSLSVVASLSRVVKMAAAIADACGNAALSEYLNSSGYAYLLDADEGEIRAWATRSAATRAAREVWQTAATEILNTWEWVIGSLNHCLLWHGEFEQSDAEALIDPFGAHSGGPPLSALPPQSPSAPSFVRAPRDDGYSTLAVAAFVLAFITSFGLPSVICGHLALSDIARTGRRGYGLAIAGVVLGYLELIFWAFVIVVFVVAWRRA